MKATSTFKAAIAAVLTSSLAGAATAGDLNVPNEFTSGNTASAAEVNANFDAAETEVGDNHSRINTLESTTSDHTSRIETLEAQGTTTRSIHLPAHSFAWVESSGVISDSVYGALWEQSQSGGMRAGFPAPSDYAGGDVTITVMFHTDGGTETGVVEFFSRTRSRSDGETEDLGEVPGGVSGSAVTVGGSSDLVYGQEITIPASRLSGAYWIISLQRGGVASSYTEPVVFHGVTLEYEANL